MVGRMLSAMLSRWPEMTRGSPPESNYLRRDIGLHPFETRRNYWDHQQRRRSAARGRYPLCVGRFRACLSVSHSARQKHALVWSLTRPIACMKA